MAPDAEHTVDFSYVNAQKRIQQPMFSIMICKGNVDPSYFEHLGWYLGADEAYTFALELVGEANEGLLHPANSEDLKNVQEILEAIEQVMLSFELN